MAVADKAPVLVMVLKGYPRISETFISNEILLLESLGFKVRIVSMRDPREKLRHASIYRIKADVVYLPEYIRPALGELVYENVRAALAAPAGYLRAAALAARHFLRTRKSATIKHLLQAGFLCRRALAPGEPAHLHAHFAHSPTSVALYAGLIAGLPVSFTGHAKDVWTQAPDRLAEKIRRAAFVVTCTRANAAYLRRLAGNATPVHAVYHGIDLALFNGTAARPEPVPPYRLLTVARLTAKKGLDTVLDALGLLVGQGLDVSWDLVGEGEDREGLVARAEALGLAGRVRFHGAMPHEMVLALYRQAHVFALGCRVLPNGDRDGVPNVVVEAMAMGLPVAATDVSALPELVRDEETGLVCRPDDPAALAGNIARLLADGTLRDRMVAAARAAVARDFDNAANTRRLAEVFARHAGRPAGAFALVREAV
ncbi:glycosyl transferase group 1 [Solidesulfovibrio carbinoliphilus subsp. oakridgensis]|uniref:Glycosyl transferase group 1 n=1 Tax=Solidesulfovibrio carbinoliphilus subsp. oakridgensis TaxID=694327 RepID=G7QAT7_9BACT|nr:glycosyltransferase family 4 protein [Solidesulfovibrio carbinoliphilus]EHJ49318.1 glycosyl transferase group 1 [Solidesulfovibrio carbinoliphilus subsp. oakridgensis]